MDPASLHAAYRRIAPHTHRTPLLTSRLLDELLGKRLLLKAEYLQKTGSFKARGALAKALTWKAPRGSSPSPAATMPRAWPTPPGCWG